MANPQIIISLSPSGNLITELPGLNGSRRKIELQKESEFALSVENAIELIKSFIKIDELQSEYNSLASKTTHVGSKEEKEKLRAEERLKTARLKIENASLVIASLQNILSNNDTTTGIIHKILENQAVSKHQIGEDGNPNEHQIKHWQKHSGIWGDPSCPFCISEGKFEKGKNREKSIRGLSEKEALRLGLISRGFVQSKNNPELWTKKNMAPIWLKTNGKVLNNKNIEWSKEHREALIQDGKIHAKKFGFNPVLPEKSHAGNKVRTITKMVRETKIEKIQSKLRNLTI